jgi:hypothetical protein
MFVGGVLYVYSACGLTPSGVATLPGSERKLLQCCCAAHMRCGFCAQVRQPTCLVFLPAVQQVAAGAAAAGAGAGIAAAAGTAAETAAAAAIAPLRRPPPSARAATAGQQQQHLSGRPYVRALRAGWVRGWAVAKQQALSSSSSSLSRRGLGV